LRRITWNAAAVSVVGHQVYRQVPGSTGYIERDSRPDHEEPWEQTPMRRVSTCKQCYTHVVWSDAPATLQIFADLRVAVVGLGGREAVELRLVWARGL
jgi:hypothetical protein